VTWSWEKNRPRTTCIFSQSRLWFTTLKRVSKYDFIVGNIEILFLIDNPTSFKLGTRTWPEDQKMQPKNYTSSPTIKTMVYNSQMGIQIWFHTRKRIFLFSTRSSTSFQNWASNVIRNWDNACRELHVFAHNQDCGVQPSNGYPNTISYIETKYCSFLHVVPRHSKLGSETWPEFEKKWPENYTSSPAI